jgi:hypothetical protein
MTLRSSSRSRPESARDYTIDELAALIRVTPASIRNALSRYRGMGFTEEDYGSGHTTVPLPYRTGRQLLWPAANVEAWMAARTRFILLPVTEQRAALARARKNRPTRREPAGAPAHLVDNL